MDAKKIALLVGALLVAGITAFFAKNLLSSSSAPEAVASVMPAKQEGPQILVATRALPVGTILGPDAFKLQPWPSDLIEGAYFKKGGYDQSKLTGMVVRNPVSAGQPLTQGALVSPGDRGFLAAALGPGMRAVTIRTSDLSGVSGFVFPGDRIDLIMTQNFKGDGKSEGGLRVAETVLRNVRVLATDKRTETVMKDGKPEVTSYSMVTLEATPRMAEKIMVAQNVGDLALSLRSLAETGSELEVAIANGATTQVKDAKGNLVPSKAGAPLPSVVARPIESGATFTTGGDVSRFQRRSLPKSAEEKSAALARELSRALSRRAPVSNSPRITFSPAPRQERGPIVKIHRPGGTTDVEVGGN